ncbi:MAG: GntR family transcriptional regulator [Ruminococcus sp.]|nr:GntR family transcriptional regulator [Ruminococcus sp.]
MWNFNNDKPVYAQIIDEIMNRIASGAYPPGERIPSVRDLAEEARVNPNTMQRALAEIERSGYIVSQRTTGKYVTSDVSLIESLNSNRAEKIVSAFAEELKRAEIPFDMAIEMLRKMQ